MKKKKSIRDSNNHTIYFAANEKRTLVVYNEEYENWVEAAKHCLNTMMFPSTISYGEKDHYDKNALKISPPSWTAFFRDQFLFIPNGGNYDIPIKIPLHVFYSQQNIVGWKFKIKAYFKHIKVLK